MFRSLFTIVLLFAVCNHAAEVDDTTINDWIRNGFSALKKTTYLKIFDYLPSTFTKGLPEVGVDDLLAAKDVVFDMNNYGNTLEFLDALQTKSPKMADYAYKATIYAQEQLGQLDKKYDGKSGALLKKITTSASGFLSEFRESFDKVMEHQHPQQEEL